MSFLSKLLTKSITKVIKNLTKFEVAIDDLIDKFKLSCPPKDELLQIVRQKNQIQGALENVVGAFNTVEATASTTQTIVTTVSSAVKVIKTIPIPTSYPPGAGIPISVITLLADSLDTLGDLLKGAKGALKVVPAATKTISEAANTVIKKLQQLDGVLNVCIEELAEGLNQAERNALINEIGNVAATSGDFVDPLLNIENEDELLSQLSPNSSNPYRYKRQPTIFIPVDPTGIYNQNSVDPESGEQIVKGSYNRYGYYAQKDWLFTIEYNNNNPLDLAQRRIRAVNTNESEFNIFSGVNVFNIGPPTYNVGETGRYSYSTSVKVLIEETKFQIDQLNVNYWRRKWILDNMEEVADNLDRDDGFISNTNSGAVTTAISGISNQPPEPITIIQPANERNIFLPVTSSNGSYNYFVQGNSNIGSFSTTKFIDIVTTIPSQSVYLSVDSGGEENLFPRPINDYGSYLSGNVKVVAEPYFESSDPFVYIGPTTVEAWKRKKVKRFIYNNPGVYKMKYTIVDQKNINSIMDGQIRVQLNP